MDFSKNTILNCNGSIVSVFMYNNMYYFITSDIHSIESYVAETDKDLKLNSSKKMPFWGISAGVYENDIVISAVDYDDNRDEIQFGVYVQSGNELKFFELHRQDNGRIPAESKAADFGIIMLYVKRLGSTHCISVYKPNKKTFAESTAIISDEWSIYENGIIPIPNSGIFFLTANTISWQSPAIFRFNADCVLQETTTLHEIFSTAPKVRGLAGCPLMPGSILFWGYDEDSKAWWFGVYDIKKKIATKSAVVPSGFGIMPELIYAIAPLADGRFVVCTPAVLFLLDADFKLQGQWTAKQKNPPGFEGVSVTKDGTLLVLGSTLVERGGKAAAWIVSVQDFSPLTEVPDAYLSTRWDTSEEE